MKKILSLFFVLPVIACSPQAAQQPAANQAPGKAGGDDSENVRLVGYNNMQGRYALQVTAKGDQANGSWVYVPNVANPRPKEGLFIDYEAQMERHVDPRRCRIRHPASGISPAGERELAFRLGVYASVPTSAIT